MAMLESMVEVAGLLTCGQMESLEGPASQVGALSLGGWDKHPTTYNCGKPAIRG